MEYALKELRKILIDFCLAATFKILYTIVATDVYLNKIGITDSGLCDNCKVAVERTEHLFLNCQITFNIWDEREREEGFQKFCQRIINLDIIQIVFVDHNFNKDNNLIVILAKRVTAKGLYAKR